MSEMITWEIEYIRDCFFYGLFLSLIYDGIRIFRIIIPHGVVSVAVEDGCYWFLAACGMFTILYQEDDGRVRWFALAAVFLAMFLMNKYISCHLVPLIGGLIAKPLHFLTRILCKGIKKLQKSAIKPLKTISKWFKIKKNARAQKRGQKRERLEKEREEKNRLEKQKTERKMEKNAHRENGKHEIQKKQKERKDYGKKKKEERRQ